MKEMNRRDFVIMTGAAAVGVALAQILRRGAAFTQAPVIGSAQVLKSGRKGSCAKVFFTKRINADHLITL